MASEYSIYGAKDDRHGERIREHISQHLLDPRAVDCVTVRPTHLELAFKSGIERRLPLPA